MFLYITIKNALDFGPLCKYFQRGSGVGGVENPLGMVNSMEECLKLSKEVDPTANGVTMTDPDGNPPPYMCSQRVGQTYVKLTDRNKFVNCFTDSVDFLDTIKSKTILIPVFIHGFSTRVM